VHLSGRGNSVASNRLITPEDIRHLLWVSLEVQTRLVEGNGNRPANGRQLETSLGVLWQHQREADRSSVGGKTTVPSDGIAGLQLLKPTDW